MALKKSIGKTLIKGAVVVAAANAVVCAVISNKKKKEENLEQSNEDHLCRHFEVIMHGQQIKLGAEEFNKVKIKTLMGGVDLDLREAVIKEDIIIKCKSVMGGINIRVPQGVNVVVQGKSLMGGITNFVPFLEGEGIPTIYVEAKQVMGGLCIKAGLPDEPAEDEPAEDEADDAEMEKAAETETVETEAVSNIEDKTSNAE